LGYSAEKTEAFETFYLLGYDAEYENIKSNIRALLDVY
jgi:hypothetical protein